MCRTANDQTYDSVERVDEIIVNGLVGGVGVSWLRVYDDEAPDGQLGGSPHMHLACAEAYVVVGGAGAVELVDHRSGPQRVPLAPGSTVQFEPGVIHRLVNVDALELVVLMQNAGLPEHGDAVFTFPADVLADAERYREQARAGSPDDARRRRDLAVRGFTELRGAFERSPAEGLAALTAFQRAAVALVGPRLPEWGAVVDAGPGRALDEARARLRALGAGSAAHLEEAVATVVEGDDQLLGMCGHLRPLVVPLATD